MEFDERVIKCFLEKQLQLFPEPVAESEEEAMFFLEDVCAFVAASAEEVKAYFEEEGIDTGEDDIMEASEVFDIGDGRYLVVEG